MEEEREEKSSQPLFLEVSCSTSGKIRRFAAGTEAGFALHVINMKLEIGEPQAFLIEAFKEGEEPVSFGPNAVLVNYGKDWKLQTVSGKGFEGAKQMQQTSGTFSKAMFLEVSCSTSGKIRRFAAGTEAGFALHVINMKLEIGEPQAFLIEAFKEGEEPVSFGPNAVLVNYGKDWKLQTVSGKGFEGAKQMQQTSGTFSKAMNLSGTGTPTWPADALGSTSGFWYVGKMFLAFAFICLLGAMLALFLENLPTLILLINSYL